MALKETSPWKLGGLSVGQLAKRTWTEINNDDGFDIAASLGYYFLLALFPMLIFLVSILTMISSTDLVNSFMTRMSSAMPPDAYSLLQRQMQNILEQSKGGLMTFGALATLWAASSGVTSLMDGLNRAYEVKESRSFIKKRLLALGLTIGLALLTIAGSAMLVASDQIAALLASATGLESMKTVGAVVSAVLGLAFVFSGFEVMFYFGPNVKGQKWAWISPGSLIGVLIFLAISFAFSLYLRFSNSYNATYGSIGGVIILMLWLYYLGLAIVFGGEANSEIARAARERGDKKAPEVAKAKDGSVGREDDMKSKTADTKSNTADTKSRKEAGAKSSTKADKDREHVPQGQLSPYRQPVGYQPNLVYAHDGSHMSLQAKRRIALRRLKRNEEAVERRQIHPQGWAILKRPLVGMVYLGSIGFYLFQAFTKHAGSEPGAAPHTAASS